MGDEEQQRHAVLAEHAAVWLRGGIQLPQPGAQVGGRGGREEGR